MPTNNSLNITTPGVVVYDGAGTWNASTFAQFSTLIGGAANSITGTTLTNGQVLVGSTGVTPVATTITAGSGISITNAAGSITVAATGGGGITSWVDVTAATQAMAVQTGYTSDNGATLVTFTLPATAAYGTIMAVVGKAAGLWKINQNAGQTIHFGTSNTTTGTGGSLASTFQYDVVYLLCSIANTDFTVLQSIGNITIV